MKFKNYIRSQKKLYLDYLEAKQDKQNKFLKKLKFINSSSGKVFHMVNDIYRKKQNDYIYYKINSEYLNKEMLKIGKIPIFLTLTLPSKYHPFSNKGKNPRFDEELTIQDGYQLLNKAHRSIYKNFRINRKNAEKVFFNKVIEPHKSFVPHLHALYYINNDENTIEAFKNHIKRVTKKLGKQKKIVVLDQDDNTVNYLLKYVKKSISDDNDDFKIIDGWKLKNKIKMFSMSNISPFPRFIYDRFTKQISDFYKNYKNEDHENIIDTMKRLVSYEIETINTFTGEVKIKKYQAKEKELYKINIERELNQNLNEKQIRRLTRKEINLKTKLRKLDNNWGWFREECEEHFKVYEKQIDTLENDEIEMRLENYCYTVKEYTIEKDEKTLYRKSDIQLLQR